MDITKNGIPQYGKINQNYTKTGQLISNEQPIVLDKNSPIIQFENDYVKNKIVSLFGGNVIPGEITQQEASLISNDLFTQKCTKLFLKYNQEISFNELKYFTQVTVLPAQMFEKTKLKNLEFPPNLNKIDDWVFYATIFTDNTVFNIPNSVTELGYDIFKKSNIKNVVGNNVITIKGDVFQSCPNLETFSYPKLKRVIPINDSNKYLQSTLFYNCPKLKSINLPELEFIQLIYYQGYTQVQPIINFDFPELEEINCPKLNQISIYINKVTKKLKKLILGNKIDRITYFTTDNIANILLPQLETIKYGFADYVQIDNIYAFSNSGSRYNNFNNALPIPKEDLSNVVFSKIPIYLNNIPNYESIVKISTETFPSSTNNFVNLGFTEIHITKSKSKIINNSIFQTSACLKKLFIETDIKEIKERAFMYCPSLREVHFNSELEKIGDWAFAFQASQYASTVSLPEKKLISLQSFNISKNVHTIGDNPLYGQEQLTKDNLTLDPENKNFILENGILYNKDKSKIILVTCDVQINKIPDTVTEIGAGAFAFNKYTGELTIPSTVKKIGFLAFAYSEFTSIKFEGNIENIDFIKQGINVTYLFFMPNNIVSFSNFYGMNNPNFIIQGEVADNKQLNKLTLNYDNGEGINITLPNTLYSEDYDLVVPVGIKAYTYKKANDGTYVKSKTYNTNDIIPKGEAVVLEGTQGEYHFPIIKNQILTKDKNNILTGTNKDIEGSGKYYIFNNGSIELGDGLHLIKENTVYIKED